MTTRGFRRAEAEALAHLIADVLDAPEDEATIARVREQARALCRRFPVYPDAPRRACRWRRRRSGQPCGVRSASTKTPP